MIRIVRSDAVTYGRLVDRTCSGFYKIDDTVLIDKNWRPEDAEEVINKNICSPKLCPYKQGTIVCRSCGAKRIFLAGFQACLEAIERKAMEKI